MTAEPRTVFRGRADQGARRLVPGPTSHNRFGLAFGELALEQRGGSFLEEEVELVRPVEILDARHALCDRAGVGGPVGVAAGCVIELELEQALGGSLQARARTFLRAPRC